jgi:hypothetical protein
MKSKHFNKTVCEIKQNAVQLTVKKNVEIAARKSVEVQTAAMVCSLEKP